RRDRGPRPLRRRGGRRPALGRHRPPRAGAGGAPAGEPRARGARLPAAAPRPPARPVGPPPRGPDGGERPVLPHLVGRHHRLGPDGRRRLPGRRGRDHRPRLPERRGRGGRLDGPQGRPPHPAGLPDRRRRHRGEHRPHRLLVDRGLRLLLTLPHRWEHQANLGRMGYPGEQRTHRPPYLHQAGRPDGDPWQAGGGSWPPYAGHGRREDAPRRDAVPYGPEPGPTPQAGPYGWETGPTLQGAMPYRPDPGHTPPGGPYSPEPSHTPQAGPYGPEPGHT